MGRQCQGLGTTNIASGRGAPFRDSARCGLFSVGASRNFLYSLIFAHHSALLSHIPLDILTTSPCTLPHPHPRWQSLRQQRTSLISKLPSMSCTMSSPNIWQTAPLKLSAAHGPSPCSGCTAVCSLLISADASMVGNVTPMGKENFVTDMETGYDGSLMGGLNAMVSYQNYYNT